MTGIYKEHMAFVVTFLALLYTIILLLYTIILLLFKMILFVFELSERSPESKNQLRDIYIYTHTVDIHVFTYIYEPFHVSININKIE